MQNVAIFGAAGAIGNAVAAELERRGIPFRAVGRSREKLEKAFGRMKHAEVFPADLSEARSAGAAARGVETIVYCVGLPYPSHHLHPVLIRTTLEAAKLVGGVKKQVSKEMPEGDLQTVKDLRNVKLFPKGQLTPPDNSYRCSHQRPPSKTTSTAVTTTFATEIGNSPFQPRLMS